MSKPPADLHVLAASSSIPFTPDHRYFADAERGEGIARAWRVHIGPFIDGEVDYTDTLDLACGHGRNSTILVDRAKRLTLVDMQPGNIAKCRERFADRTNVTYIINNGFDLKPVPDASISLVYCFDSMVHFDSDVVRAYLGEIRRVLKVGGRAFLHHSNYTGPLTLGFFGPHGRNFMTKELFAHYATKERLTVVKQLVIDWAEMSNHDCLSLIQSD